MVDYPLYRLPPLCFQNVCFWEVYLAEIGTDLSHSEVLDDSQTFRNLGKESSKQVSVTAVAGLPSPLSHMVPPVGHISRSLI